MVLWGGATAMALSSHRTDAPPSEQLPCRTAWHDLLRTEPYGANRRRIGVIPGGVSHHRFGTDSFRKGAGSLADIALDPVASTVCLPPGLCLDPGGIGKGWPPIWWCGACSPAERLVRC